MLTKYFVMCSKHIEARQYLYREFPKHYVWDKQAKCWSKRKKGGVIGGINGAKPAEGERYYLRLLLNHVRGLTSFDDLLTFDGTTYLTFKEAAQKRGLLESDESIVECLAEAVTFQMPEALRRLFVIILVYCEPSDVRTLWDTNLEFLSEDFKIIHPHSTIAQLSCTLKSINSFLESIGKNIANYDLPVLNSCPIGPNEFICREVEEELVVETPQEDFNLSSHLNMDQKTAYHLILERVLTGKSGAFFVDGPGGTGKTYLYRALLADIRNKGMVVLATATSGVAASIMPGGRTTHSRFKIPIEENETTLCNILKQSGTSNLIRSASLIIWDEVPMAKRFAIKTLD